MVNAGIVKADTADLSAHPKKTFALRSTETGDYDTRVD